MKWNKFFSIAAAVVGLSGFADTTRPLYVASENDAEGGSVFTNAAAWKLDGAGTVATEPPNEANDYLILASIARTPEPKKTGERYVFGGNSLHLGRLLPKEQVGNLLIRNASYDTTLEFSNEGLYLHQGYFGSWNDHNTAVYGTVHVDATEAAPFRFFTSGGDGGSMDFYGPFLGSGYLWIHSRLASGSQLTRDMPCTFHNDALKDFMGTIDTYWCQKEKLSDTLNTNGYSQTFVTETGSFPGHLRLNCGSKYRPFAADTAFTVGKLTLGNDTELGVAVTASSASRVTVTDQLVIKDCVTVRVTGGQPTIDELIAATDAQGKVYVSPGAQSILDAPAGTDLPGTLSVKTGADDVPALVSYAFTEPMSDEGTGAVTIGVKTAAKKVVRMIGADDGWNKTSFASTGADVPSTWSDGQAPTDPESAYLVVGKTVRTVLDTTTADVFKGQSLTYYWASGTKPKLSVCSGGVEVPDLRAFGAMIIESLTDGGIGTPFDGLYDEANLNAIVPVRGRIGVSNSGDSDKALEFWSYATKTFDVEAEIYGKGLIHVRTYAQSGVNKDSGLRLRGTNTNWFGRIQVTSHVGSHYSHLYVSDASNLGGALPSWTINALTLSTRAVLHAEKSFTLDTPNRGINISESTGAEIAVPEGVVFTCKERFTRGGPLAKTGAGTFALGGERAYYNWSGSTTPVEKKNVLDIREGALKPASDVVFQGLAVKMASGTEIAIDVPTDRTQGVGKYGMLDTEWDTPFELPAEGVTVRVTDPDGAAKPSRKLVRPLMVPVMTVKKTAADAIRGKLRPISPYADYHASIVEISDGNNVTFAVRLDRGVLLILR